MCHGLTCVMVTETITLGDHVASLSTTHDNAPLMICIMSLKSHSLSLYQSPSLRERVLSEQYISLSPGLNNITLPRLLEGFYSHSSSLFSKYRVKLQHLNHARS